MQAESIEAIEFNLQRLEIARFANEAAQTASQPGSIIFFPADVESDWSEPATPTKVPVQPNYARDHFFYELGLLAIFFVYRYFDEI